MHEIASTEMSAADSPTGLRRSPHRDASARSRFASPSSQNARVLEMTDTVDGPVVNKDDALAANRKTLSK